MSFIDLLDVFFPPECAACGGLVETSPYRYLCAGCARELDFVGPPSAVRFQGAARQLIHTLKYRGRRHVIRDIEAVFRRSPGLLAMARGAVLVPVPLHSRRRRERGFNQSELIARALARAAGSCLGVACLLVRRDDGPAQASLDRAERPANVKNAFALARGADLNPRLRYLIIDDVVTTGSTLESCAHVLRAAGGLNLDAATFAHG